MKVNVTVRVKLRLSTIRGSMRAFQGLLWVVVTPSHKTRNTLRSDSVRQYSSYYEDLD